MIIDLRTILEESRRFRFGLETNWWHREGEQDQVVGMDTPVEVKIEIYKAGDKYVLDGKMHGGLLVVCDRCLEVYHRELKTTFRVFFALPLAETGETEIELAEKDLEVDFIRGEEIELDDIIREQILLSLPMKSLCSEHCEGLCPTCGSNLNAGDCQCHREQGHPAFLKLKNLKIEGEQSREMAVPKKRKSKSKRDMRRSHDHVKLPNVSLCPQCHEPVLPHHVCPHCGSYRGKTLVKTEET